MPVNQLTLDVVNVRVGSPESAGITTTVSGTEPWGNNGAEVQRRDDKRLNIADARSRFINFPPVFNNLDSYGLVARPQQGADAAGSSLETVEDLLEGGVVDPEKYAASTEIFHVDDFINAIQFTVQGSKTEKLVHHIRGLMHRNLQNDESSYSIRDTDVPSASGRPETIRRTPRRFITKTRRFIRFEEDFVTHNLDDFIDSVEVLDYRKALHGTRRPDQYLNSRNSAESTQRADRLGRLVTKSKSDEQEYYIVPENGEDLLNFYEKYKQEGFSLYHNTFDHSSQTDDVESLYNNNVLPICEQIGNNFVENDMQLALSSPGEEMFSSALHREEVSGLMIPSFRARTIAVSSSPSSRYGGVTCRADAIIRDYEQVPAEDEIKYRYSVPGAFELENNLRIREQDQNSSKVRVVFENKIGKFETKEAFDKAKSILVGTLDTNSNIQEENPGIDPIEEHWVETVYEFSGDSSILAGIYGSFTIGETMDPAVLKFKPSRSLVDKFNTDLKDLIRRYTGTKYWNFEKLYNNIGWSYGGSTFWTDDPSVNQEYSNSDYDVIPLIARPMGIDKQTNLKLTSPLLIRSQDALDEYLKLYRPFKLEEISSNLVASGFYTSENFGLKPNLDGSLRNGYRDICCMIHESPRYVPDTNRLIYKKTSLLPPNIYKIPIRVVVTQVYVDDVVTQAYCKVIPPKYLQNCNKEKKSQRCRKT